MKLKANIYSTNCVLKQKWYKICANSLIFAVVGAVIYSHSLGPIFTVPYSLNFDEPVGLLVAECTQVSAGKVSTYAVVVNAASNPFILEVYPNPTTTKPNKT